MPAKKSYILDENLLHHAAKLENHKGEMNTEALIMILNIDYHCHSIVVSEELEKKYYSNTLPKIRKVTKSDPNIITKLILWILPNKNKFRRWSSVIFSSILSSVCPAY